MAALPALWGSLAKGKKAQWGKLKKGEDSGAKRKWAAGAPCCGSSVPPASTWHTCRGPWGFIVYKVALADAAQAHMEPTSCSRSTEGAAGVLQGQRAGLPGGPHFPDTALEPQPSLRAITFAQPSTAGTAIAVAGPHTRPRCPGVSSPSVYPADVTGPAKGFAWQRSISLL